MLANNWTKLIFVLVGAGLVSAVLMTMLPAGLGRDLTFWLLTVPVVILLVIGGVGWAFTEIRIVERDAQVRRVESGRPPRSQAAQIFGYFAVLVLVAALAITGALIPTRYAPLIWSVYLPASFVAAWLLRMRRTRSQNRRIDR